MIAKEILLWGEEAGSNALPLSRLETLPEPVLRQVVPVMFRGRTIVRREEHVWVRTTSRLERRIGTVDDLEGLALSRFDRGGTLETIGLECARTLALDGEESVRRVCAFFLRLADQRICHPANEDLVRRHLAGDAPPEPGRAESGGAHRSARGEVE